MKKKDQIEFFRLEQKKINSGRKTQIKFSCKIKLIKQAVNFKVIPFSERKKQNVNKHANVGEVTGVNSDQFFFFFNTVCVR